MAKSPSINYSRLKSHYGGIPGTIQIHTVPGIGFNNDPTTAVFKDNIPAGFLKCDGTVKNVKDFYALAQILGIGDECRFKKETTTLRNPDTEVNDLGSFQLPDLGSKVMMAGRGSGEYSSVTLSNSPSTSRVGVEVEPVSNIGDRAIVNYIGNMTVTGQPSINFNGNVKYIIDKDTSPYALSIEEFQAHHHSADFGVFNFTGNHDITGQGKGNTANNANASGGNVLEELLPNIPTGESTHDHSIGRPFTYSSSFGYSFPSVSVPLDEMFSYVDIDINEIDVLNQVVTPFIMVHYIIKF